MDQELISKKDLLKITEISYGQLYRWKRKNLIPEDWFIKKSSFTGQETFFPKKDILERIEKIKSFKEDVSLDELANIFSPQLENTALTIQDIINKNIVSNATLEIYKNIYKDSEIISFNNILYLTIVDKFLSSGEVSTDEAKNIFVTISENYDNFKDRYCDIVVIRKFGTAICFLLLSPNEMYIESSAKLVMKINAAKCVEELKSKITN